jgi:hypothetical protein
MASPARNSNTSSTPPPLTAQTTPPSPSPASKNEIAKHGEYHTQRLVLKDWDDLSSDSSTKNRITYLAVSMRNPVRLLV